MIRILQYNYLEFVSVNEVHVDMKCICQVIITLDVNVVSLFSKLYHHLFVCSTIAGAMLFNVFGLKSNNGYIESLTHLK